jgi:hypothetical protein
MDYQYAKEQKLKGRRNDPSILNTDYTFDRMLLKDAAKWCAWERSTLETDLKHTEKWKDEPTDTKAFKVLGGS